MEKIPDINDGEKSLRYGHSSRTLLPREKLLLEHIFVGWPEVDQVVWFRASVEHCGNLHVWMILWIGFKSAVLISCFSYRVIFLIQESKSSLSIYQFHKTWHSFKYRLIMLSKIKYVSSQLPIFNFFNLNSFESDSWSSLHRCQLVLSSWLSQFSSFKIHVTHQVGCSSFLSGIWKAY